ncbi:MAG: hypothetical protein V1774_11555 [Candidatus Eisenbacteria bacterium]
MLELLRRATQAFTLGDLPRQPFVRGAIGRDVIGIGQHGGVRQSVDLSRAMIEMFGRRFGRVLVLLELDFARQEVVDAYASGGGPLTADLQSAMETACGNGLGLARPCVEAIRAGNLEAPGTFRVGCIDLPQRGFPDPAASAADPRWKMCREILAIRDRDLLDAAREQFIFQEAARVIAACPAERVLVCGSNAHVGHSSYRFDRHGLPRLHVPALLHRIAADLRMNVFSMFFFPVSGQEGLCSDGRGVTRELPPADEDPVLRALGELASEPGAYYATDLSLLPAASSEIRLYTQSWDAIVSAAGVAPMAEAGDAAAPARRPAPAVPQ